MKLKRRGLRTKRSLGDNYLIGLFEINYLVTEFKLGKMG